LPKRPPNRERKRNSGYQEPKELPVEAVVAMRTKKTELDNQQQNPERDKD
jgi:hypothetical protein